MNRAISHLTDGMLHRIGSGTGRGRIACIFDIGRLHTRTCKICSRMPLAPVQANGGYIAGLGLEEELFHMP